MPGLLRSSETTLAIGSTIELDSGEVISTSIARSVRLTLAWHKQDGFLKRLLAFQGQKLYYEDNLYKNAGTAMTLRVTYPEQAPELGFKNPVLAAFSNAVWHCATAAQVCIAITEAAAKSSADPENAAALATMWAAYQVAQNLPAATTYLFFYANGRSEEVHLSQTPSEIARFLTTSYKQDKRENDPDRTVRVVDQRGRIVWGK
jgi:hypothetical protein